MHSQSAGDKISLSEYRGALLEDDIRAAIDYVMRYDALAAYAVEKIAYEIAFGRRMLRELNGEFC